jgi:hypothetical protein
MVRRSPLALLLIALSVLTGTGHGLVSGQSTTRDVSVKGSEPTLNLPDNLKFEPPWRDKGDCGPLALYLLMRLHDRPVTIDEVKRVVPYDPDRGCSLADLDRGAEALSFPVETRFVNPRDLNKLPFPFILHTAGSLERGTGHFHVIVSYDAQERKYRVIDISVGTVGKMPEEGILNDFAGYVLLSRRPLDAGNSRLLGLFFVGLTAVFGTMAIYVSYFRRNKARLERIESTVEADGSTLVSP